MELSKALSKVRALIERAEHPSTPPEEAATARKLADSMMEKYAIEEWQALKDSGASLKPSKIRVDLGEHDHPFLTEIATLANIVANFCRCTSIWMRSSGYGNRPEYAYVYGYETDLRYFEMLFTTLMLHMSGVIFPRPAPDLTMGEDVYRLHNSGLSWTDIAEVYGYVMVGKNLYNNGKTGETDVVANKLRGKFKGAYQKECRLRGEEPVYLPAKPDAKRNWRYNAAQGYLRRIDQRLREQLGQRGTGAELVLRDRTQNIVSLVNEEHPSLTVSPARNVAYNPEAYRRGVSHANSASLAPEAGAPDSKALG